MKKITLFTFILTLFIGMNSGFSQKVVIIGMNHISGSAGDDGFTFVATEDIPAGEVIYFTDNEYDDAANSFTFGIGSTGEGVIRYVVGAGGLATGVVVFMNESLGSNTFSITCSSGDCGSYTTSTSFGNGSFNLATNGDGLYAYSDTDENVTNGITQIYSVMYTGSGESPVQNGGIIPINENPISDYPTAVVVDGFPPGTLPDTIGQFGPDRVEFGFSPSSLRDGVSQAGLENPTNYVSYVSQQLLSTVPFTNLSLTGSNPVATVTVSPTTLLENSGSSYTYTFSLDSNAASEITVNFTVSGSATFNTDYTQSNADTFNSSSGTVIINSGTNSKTLTITPTGDTDLEPDETVIITLGAGTGYDAGSPSVATATIENDDSISITPVVAIVGTTHSPPISPESFSFVALDDIAEGTQVYFTENSFNNNSLVFSGSEGVAVWTAPLGGVSRGQVIVVTETSANTFSTSCDSGSCGAVSSVSGNWDLASQGESVFAYTDSDTDHTNGITHIDAVFFTGTSSTSGGTIPTIEDPSGIYVGSVVVDGFSANVPERTEYDPALRGVSVDQANFQNTGNWLHSEPTGTLSTTPFLNIIIATGSPNPTLTVSALLNTGAEDSGTNLVYTFLLDSNATTDTTINFDVTGTATFNDDYTVSGAATFDASSGTAIILNGNDSVSVTVIPTADSVVEPTETVILTIASGTGYDGGSPNAATTSITNDDTSNSDPLVAITGMNHVSPDGFSFVAAKDIPANTTIYFTENEFDNSTLFFNTGEGVFVYTSPSTIIPAGDVIVIKETAPNTFSLTCNMNVGPTCGTFALVSGTLAFDTLGETLYAYEDSDNDPSNGVDDIYAVMYTGLSSGPSGGSIPSNQDPTGIYLNALVIDGFPASNPDRSEYRYASNERGIAVGQADFENTSTNWLHGQTNLDLSPIPFADLNIVVSMTALADLCVDAGVQTGLGSGFPTGGVYSGAGVTDDGNGTTYSFDPAAAGVGTHTLTYTFSGTSGTDDVEVFALPTVTYTALADLCVNAGVQTGLGGGNPTGGVYSGPGVSDNGNGMTYSFDPAAAGVGTHTLIYTFTDTNGCTNSASDNVEVFALPTVTFTAPAPDVCIEDAVVTGLGGGLPSGGVYSGIGVADDGNGMTFSFDPTALDPAGGNATITYTFTNTNGCSNSANDDIFVDPICCELIVDCSNIVDTELSCRADLPPVDFDLPIIVESCGNTVLSALTIIPGNSGCPSDPITITRTYFIQDADGNQTQCDQTFTVISRVGPTVTPESTTISENLDANCEFVIPDYADLATSTAECGLAPITQNPAPGTVINSATDTIITLTATDSCGRTSTADITLSTFDVTPPTVVTQDITISLNGSGNTSIDTYQIDNGSTDACGIALMTVSPNSFDCSNVGENTVTLTVTDTSGNVSESNSIVIIEDVTPPIVKSKNVTVYLDENGEAIINPNDFDNGSIDNCGVDRNVININGSIHFDELIVDCSNIGETQVTFTVIDINDNARSIKRVLTVIDNSPPTVVTQNISVELDENGMASIVTSDIDNGSSDNCGIESMSLDITSFDCSNVGDNTVTLSATDVNGNINQNTAIVTIIDNIAPTVLTKNITVELDENGMASVAATDIDNGSSDNCGIESMSLDMTSFDCSNLGDNTVTLSVTDVNGNTNTNSATVSVSDNIDPTAVTQNVIVQLDINGMASITAADIDNGSSDNCNIESISLDVTSFDCTSLGDTTVTLTITDTAGNSSSATAIVTVIDDLAPSVSTQNITINLGDDGMANITTSDIDYGSSDNCGIESMSLDMTAFDCSNVGDNTVTLSVTDVNGNTNQNTAIVTVIDTVFPIVNCVAPFALELDDTGTASVTVDEINNGSSDNCGIESITIDKTTFDCNDIGDNTITLTVIDTSGNESICTTVVTITDSTNPIVITQNISIELDDNGNAYVDPADIDDGSFDSCGIATMSLDVSDFSCPTLGEHIVTLTVVDTNGNSASEIAIVTFTGNDLDNDGIANMCDDDMDGDGVANDIDNCITTPNADQADLDRNGIGDVCDEGELSIPKGFSPNSDGVNDEFIIEGLHKFSNNSIEVFNRYGHLVYEERNYQNYWDGIGNKKEKRLPAGPYFYVLNIGNGQRVLKGWVYINY